MGLRPSKQVHQLHNLDMGSFQYVLDEIRDVIHRAFGYRAVKATLIPELELWVFYDEDDRPLMRVSHDTVERLTTVKHDQFMARNNAELAAMPRSWEQ